MSTREGTTEGGRGCAGAIRGAMRAVAHSAGGWQGNRRGMAVPGLATGVILPSPRLRAPGEGALNRTPRECCVKRVPPRTAARWPTGPTRKKLGTEAGASLCPALCPFSGSASAERRGPESEGPPDAAVSSLGPRGRAGACTGENTGASPQVCTPVTTPTAHDPCSPHPAPTGTLLCC